MSGFLVDEFRYATKVSGPPRHNTSHFTHLGRIQFLLSPHFLFLTRSAFLTLQGLALMHPEVTSRNVERRNEILKNCGAGSKAILDSVVSTMLR